MRIGIVAEANNWHSNALLQAASHLECHAFSYADLGACFDTTERSKFTVRGLSDSLDEFDALIIRPMPSASLTQIVFRMDLLDQLQRQYHTVVVNPAKTIECCVDKYLSLERLRQARLPVPRTTVAQTVEQANEHFGLLGHESVCKPIFGSGGKGVRRLSNPESAADHFRQLESQGQVIYQQEFIEHGDFDLRLLVIGEVVLGMKRVLKGQWLTNIQQGASAERYTPTSMDQELAVRATQAVGAEIAGVDVIFDALGSPLIVEINACPAWKALDSVVSVDVAELIIEFVESRVRASK